MGGAPEERRPTRQLVDIPVPSGLRDYGDFEGFHSGQGLTQRFAAQNVDILVPGGKRARGGT